ncbi:MAG: PD40 domain-containing protein [Planctomycetaceae bacterium]|nr:PD40 domain-containing protein [Planctomycetaceae bacterium]
MLCGRPPFVGDPWTIISRVASERENPPPPRSVQPDVPRDLEACCLKALEKNPKVRYPNLQALADDLDHWLKGLPLLARPIGPVEQLQRWCRQNRLIASMGGTLALIFITAAIVGPLLAVRYQDLADIATRKAKDAVDARKLEKKAHEATERARELEKTARLATERSVIDSYTETGLTAHRNNDPREAILWFANAVAASENFPSREKQNRIRLQSWLSREKQNRIRLQSWLSQVATPVQAFDLAPAWKKTLSYHPSSRWLLSLTSNGECELLQISDGKRLPLPMDGPVSAATFSPDGKTLVMASGQEVVVFAFQDDGTDKSGTSHETHPSHRLHENVQTKELDRWTHPDAVNDFQFGADGQLLVVGGENTVQVRDVPKKAFQTEPIEVGSQVLSAAITPDGHRFAVRGFDQKVRVFSCAPDRTHSEPLLPVQPSTSFSNFPPLFVGNDLLVISDDYQSVCCWNIDKKEIVWTHKPTRVLSMAISPDETWIALGEDAEVVLLDTATGEPGKQRLKHSNLVNNLSFHPTSPLLLTASVDHTAHLFEVPSGKPVGPAILHCEAVHRCVWSPDGASFATVHWTGDLVRVWKPCDHRPEETLAAPSARGPFVRFNQQGDRWLPSGFDNGRDRTELEVFYLKLGRPVGPKLSGPGLISDADFISKSQLVVVVGGATREDARHGLPKQKLGDPGFVRFMNLETGEPVFEELKTPSQPIAVRTSPDGQTVVVLCHLGHLLLLDPATGKPCAEHQAFDGQPAVHGFVIRDRIRFSKRGDQFALWGCNALAELRKTDTGERVASIPHESGFIHDVQFSPDGKLVATCSSDHSLRLWDTTTGSSAGPPLAHSGWVFSAQFSQDGRRLLTASSDKQARIWDLATRTAILATREHGDQVFSVAFLPGEELFLASTRDGQITAWDSSLGKMIAPARQLPGMVYQLSLHGSSPRVIASGNISPMRVFDWNQWILEPDTELNREDVRLLGEIVSSQRVHEGGAATSLTSAEWIDRWKQFRAKHPDGPALKLSPRKSHPSD